MTSNAIHQPTSLSVDLSNEFASVTIAIDTQARGMRLQVVDLESGESVFLDPLELASFCHADEHERQAWLRTGDYRDGQS